MSHTALVSIGTGVAAQGLQPVYVDVQVTRVFSVNVHDNSCNCSSCIACTVVAKQYWFSLQWSGLSARCRLDCSLSQA